MSFNQFQNIFSWTYNLIQRFHIVEILFVTNIYFLNGIKLSVQVHNEYYRLEFARFCHLCRWKWWLIFHCFPWKLSVLWWLQSHVLRDCILGTYYCILRCDPPYSIVASTHLLANYLIFMLYYVNKCIMIPWIRWKISCYVHIFIAGSKAEDSFLVPVFIVSFNHRASFGDARYVLKITTSIFLLPWGVIFLYLCYVMETCCRCSFF